MGQGLGDKDDYQKEREKEGRALHFPQSPFHRNTYHIENLSYIKKERKKRKEKEGAQERLRSVNFWRRLSPKTNSYLGMKNFHLPFSILLCN